MADDRLRCQRIGCDATFTEEDNPEGSCQYHDSPMFHDGMKEWSCCKKKSHDFSLFLEIPGCKTGKHTTEKPVLAKVNSTPKAPVSKPSVPSATSAPSREVCPRCKQGFFCSDHGSQPKEDAAPAKSTAETQVSAPPAKKKININEPQTCRNSGCGQTFKEINNHDTACTYHPGPAVFHDRIRGWKCCDIHVKEFDEFMSIPPCTKGWHNANPTS
ncbi:unnamed protein product [Linum tenue]|uniref:CHORD domain-containing protein n=1 Tax=Linum tenue TaxID=586396 RepID=A0AAV0QSA1_9ROSI|nr:unnamed protein product [Linum tenue]